MAFLKEVEGFKRSSLRKTDTNYTRGDGLTFIERRDDSGNLIVIPTGAKTLSFIEDPNPDLEVAEILPGLFLASVDVASSQEVLEKYGITHILCTTSMQLEYFPGQFNYKHVLIVDLPSTNITVAFDECFSFVDEALAASGKVLVHCMAGVSRSATIVIAYLMKSKSMDFQQAFDHVKSCRPVIYPNEGFMAQLRSYVPH